MTVDAPPDYSQSSHHLLYLNKQAETKKTVIKCSGILFREGEKCPQMKKSSPRLRPGAEVAYQAPGSLLAALHGAVAGKCVVSARHLLADGANIDAKQHGGYTALMAAAANGLIEMLTLLLEHDADPAITEDQGNTAGDQALQKGQAKAANLLPA